MKKKILVRGPVLTQSGYGEQARFALRALKSKPDLFEVFIHPVTWGQTGWIWEDNEFRRWMDERISATAHENQNNSLAADISLQVTIPNEWEKLAPINIGYTAGIETTAVSPNWLLKGNDMNNIIVVSTHAKNTYTDTVATATNNQTGEESPYRLETNIDAVNYAVRNIDPAPIPDFDLSNNFNFLMVSQMGPRKNTENAIRWWVEEFVDQKVGLIVKTNFRGNSIIDREYTFDYLKKLLESYPDRKCKVQLLHGDLSDGQMAWLYRHQKVKALVNIAHGEGFGLPMFEAAQAALPVITIGWSGQKDFLEHNGTQYFTSVNYMLSPIQKEAEWEGVLEPGSQWAFADQGSYKMALRKVKKNWKSAQAKATKLQKIIMEEFAEEKIYQQFCDAVYKRDPALEEWQNNLDEMETV
jgi:glycosyltransferase involved in cell wall biosynthesis